MKLLYARDRRALLAGDQRLCAASDAGLFVTQGEVDLFSRLCPEQASKLVAISNGVDAVDFFAREVLPLIQNERKEALEGIGLIGRCLEAKALK